MNPQSENNSALTPSNAIIEGEIIETHSNHPDDETIDLSPIQLNGDFKNNKDSEPSISLRLTPWGIGAIALFLFSNLLLTWAQFSQKPTLETAQTPLDIPNVTENDLAISSEDKITPDSLSTLPKPVQSPSAVPSPPPSPQTVAKVPTPPKPPQPTLSEQILPPSLRPKPAKVVPVSTQSRNQPPQPVPVPPSVKPEPVAAPPSPNPPELSKEEQLRNILRQQIMREEAENEPPLSFNHRTRQNMIEKKLREYHAQEAARQAAQEAATASSNPVPQPPQPQTANPVSPVSPPPLPTVQAKPQNVNQLVNQLESFNQK